MTDQLHVAYSVKSRATTISIDQDDLDVTGSTSGLNQKTVRVTGLRVIDYMNGTARVLVIGHPIRNSDGQPGPTTIDVRVNIPGLTYNGLSHPDAPDWLVSLVHDTVTGAL
jgi:hypothetical protein